MSKKKTFIELAAEDKKAKEDAVKAFDIDDFAGKTDEQCTLNVDGYAVNYKLLSTKEVRQIKKLLLEKGAFDLEEYGLALVSAMMNKCDGKTTAEKMDTLPGALVNKILNELGKASGFL